MINLMSVLNTVDTFDSAFNSYPDLPNGSTRAINMLEEESGSLSPPGAPGSGDPYISQSFGSSSLQRLGRAPQAGDTISFAFTARQFATTVRIYLEPVSFNPYATAPVVNQLVSAGQTAQISYTLTAPLTNFTIAAISSDNTYEYVTDVTISYVVDIPAIVQPLAPKVCDFKQTFD